jgi:hypothetical protein
MLLIIMFSSDCVTCTTSVYVFYNTRTCSECNKFRLLEQNSTPVRLILSELSANSTVAECEVTTQNGNRGNESVHFTKESIYLLRTHHTFTLTLKAAPIDSNESLGMNPPRNMMCVRLAVCGLGFI